jgi:uncharacterized membrane protein
MKTTTTSFANIQSATVNTSNNTTTFPPIPKQRIESIDILRGLVMLIMAIDHTRDFLLAGHPNPTNLATTTFFLFFTRWITHFCAPTFIFLSGISAFLAGKRRTTAQLATFLITRGLWLFLVEVLLITFALTLNPFYNVVILQVIWAIGGSMIILGVLVRLKASPYLIGIIGVIIFFGHNMIDVINFGAVTKEFAWHLLLSAKGFSEFWPVGQSRGILALYALLPWAGVMMIGYAFGTIYENSFDAVKRRKTLLSMGFSLLAFFLVFRYFNIYGDPAPWSVQKTTILSIISFFNVTKYPCSLLYLCMTLGVALMALALTEKIKNKFTAILIVFGNVPFFYYICHFYLIRAINVIVFFAIGYNSSQIVSATQRPFEPDALGFNLAGLYLVWMLVIFILYFPCRWYGKYKTTHKQWWLSYI